LPALEVPALEIAERRRRQSLTAALTLSKGRLRHRLRCLSQTRCELSDSQKAVVQARAKADV
jgi:hypothetical protein